MTNCTVRASFVIRNSSFVIFNMGTAPKPAKVGWLGHSGVPASPGEVRSPQAPESARDWAQVLRHHAEVEPDRAQIHLLEGDSGEDITYGRLLETASTVAAGLVARGLERDETVAIMLPTSADFFYAFFGVM